MLGMSATPGGLVPLRKPSRFSVARKPPVWMTRYERAGSRGMVTPPHAALGQDPASAQVWMDENLKQMPNCAEPLKPEEFFTDVFWYQVDFIAQNNNANIAAGAAVPGRLNFDQGSDFVWTKAMFVREPVGRVTLRMFDEGTNRSLMNGAIDVDAYISGSPQRPAVLPAMRVVPANTTMWFELTNAGAAALTFCTLVLAGYKILYPSRQNLTSGMQSC